MTEEQKQKIKDEYIKAEKERKRQFWLKAMRIKNYEVMKLLTELDKKKV